MTKKEQEYLDTTYDMFRKHWLETNNSEESWELTKRLLHWYRIGVKDGATMQHKLEFQEPIAVGKVYKTRLFENAYFGKVYKTRCGRKAIYIGKDVYSNEHVLCLESNFINYNYFENGKCKAFPNNSADIVSEWPKEINEQELDRISYESASPSLQDGILSLRLYKEGFKAGYHKALEQL